MGDFNNSGLWNARCQLKTLYNKTTTGYYLSLMLFFADYRLWISRTLCVDYHQGGIYTSIALVFLLEEASIHWHFVFRYYSPLNGGGKGKPCLHYSLCYSLFFVSSFLFFFSPFGPVFSPPWSPKVYCSVFCSTTLFCFISSWSVLSPAFTCIGHSIFIRISEGAQFKPVPCFICCIRLRLLVACLLVGYICSIITVLLSLTA